MENRDGWWWPEADRHCWEAKGDVGDLKYALEVCKGRSVALQAGGNCGVWAKSLCWKFDEVWTVEADLNNYRCLVRNVNCPNVRPVWAALGDSPGSCGLYTFDMNAGASHVWGKGRVPVITIDELDLPACDLIVLDIEGYEPKALAGAKNTLEKFRPVLMIEENGLSKQFGVPQGWTESIPGYRVVTRISRDVVLVPC